MDKSERVSVTISFGDNGTIYGCGHALDTMLCAYGLTTEEETWEWIVDAERDAMNYVLKEYDFETYTLERLNNGKASDMLGEILKRQIAVGALSATEIDTSEYLPGDWLRFNHPAAFESLVSHDQTFICELVEDTIGDWTSEAIPADLRKELIRAHESTQRESRHEWLHGDRSNDGVLSRLAKVLFGRYTDAEVAWETKTDTVTIDATTDEWREWMGYDLADGEPLPDPKTLGENMRDVTLYKAQEVKKKKDAARESRQQERARLEERRRLQEEDEREAARQRKIKKDQAS